MILNINLMQNYRKSGNSQQQSTVTDERCEEYFSHTENSLQYGYDENDNKNMSNETKCETNYSINNKWNTRNKHLTKDDTNDDVDLNNCVVHTVR